jgi:hypothetical protein
VDMTEFKDDLHETNVLIREVILPQLVRIEAELVSLRKHVWPYVQSKKEGYTLSDMEEKIDFLKLLDRDTVNDLLIRKARVSSSRSGVHAREFDIIKNHFC